LQENIIFVQGNVCIESRAQWA